MANWTKATLLGRLIDVLAEGDDKDAVAILTDPEKALDGMPAAKVIEILKDAIVKDSMRGR